MTLYLQMNGTSDKIVTPSMSANTVIMDIQLDTKLSWEYYFKSFTGYNFYIAQSGSNKEVWASTETVYLNDTVQPTSGAISFPRDQRITIKAIINAVITDGFNIFNENNSSYVKGRIYSIKFYNGATLVANYDMSTGTVQDVSGNGYNATLTGGTWLDDGTGGGTGTTYSGSGTSAGTSSLTSSEKVIQSASGSAQGNSSLASAEKATLSASGTAQGNSSLSSSETVISHTGTTYSASGTAQGSSSLTSSDKVAFWANGTSHGTTILSPGEHLILPSIGTSTGQSSISSNETVVGHGTTTYSASGQAQGNSSLSSAETMIYSANGTAQGLSSLIAHEIISLLASGISEGYSTLTFIDKSNQIIGTIHLKGSQVLNVNLKGGI